MYIGRVGIIQAARRPSTICVISGGKICGDIKGLRPIAMVTVKIGHYIKEDAIALFDTGASESVLCMPNARKKIGTEPEDASFIRGIDGEMKDVYYYNASIKFQNNASVDIGLIDVYEGEFDFADIIIGMDIISKGTLIVNGKEGIFTFEL